MKKILSLILAAALCLMLLAACASTNEQTPNTNDQENSQQTNNTGDAADTEDNTPDDEAPVDDEDEASEDESEDDEEQEIVEIVMTYLDIPGKGETAGAMVDALNEITEREIGVHVKIEFMGMGDYSSKVGLMLSSGEQLDIVGLTPFPSSGFSGMFSSGQLLDITDYLQQDYAAGIMEAVGDYLNAFTVDGAIYGIPAYRNFATGHYIAMRSDMLEELNLIDTANNMTTWAEFESILQAVTDAYGGSGTYAISKGDTPSLVSLADFDTDMNGAFSDGTYFDALGDSTNTIMAFEDGTIISRAQSEVNKARLQKLAEWADAGYVYPDSAYDTQNAGSDLMKSNVTFSFVVDSEYGIEASLAARTGYDITAVEIAPCFVKTSTITTWGMGIPYSTEEPVAAMKFINLMYTNADVMNLITWGIEGEDYVVTDGVADYVDGSSENANWHGSDWLFGNQFLVLPWAGTEANYREICKRMTEDAPTSSYLGFTFNTSELSNTVAALSATYDQYNGVLNCGGYTDALFDEYTTAMEAAGVASYIEAANEQLDAWR